MKENMITLPGLVLFICFFVLSLIIFLKKKPLRKKVLVLSILTLGLVMGRLLDPVSILKNVFLHFNILNLALFMIPVIVTLFVGRLFCGYVCFFGAIQELIHLSKLKIRIPEADLYLSKFKYLILVFLLFSLTILRDIIGFSGNYLFASSGSGNVWKCLLIVIAIFLSIIIYRPFCRFVCPLGAFLGLISKLNRFRMLPEECGKCGYCTASCRCRRLAMV